MAAEYRPLPNTARRRNAKKPGAQREVEVVWFQLSSLTPRRIVLHHGVHASYPTILTAFCTSCATEPAHAGSGEKRDHACVQVFATDEKFCAASAVPMQPHPSRMWHRHACAPSTPTCGARLAAQSCSMRSHSPDMSFSTGVRSPAPSGGVPNASRAFSVTPHVAPKPWAMQVPAPPCSRQLSQRSCSRRIQI